MQKTGSTMGKTGSQKREIGDCLAALGSSERRVNPFLRETAVFEPEAIAAMSERPSAACRGRCLGEIGTSLLVSILPMQCAGMYCPVQFCTDSSRVQGGAGGRFAPMNYYLEISDRNCIIYKHFQQKLYTHSLNLTKKSV